VAVPEGRRRHHGRRVGHPRARRPDAHHDRNGEFGGTDEEPFRDRFYTLALQPMSRNPYTRSTTIL
jgi:hypothetical protein